LLQIPCSIVLANEQFPNSSTGNAGKLQSILDNSRDGDVIALSSGVYSGNFNINHSIILRGDANVTIDGLGKNDAIRVTASNVVIENLHIRNWGDDLTLMNAGIFVEKSATNILIQNNYLKGDVTGIWLDKCDGAKVISNRVEGNLNLRSVDRGNGIHLSLVTNTEVRSNEVWFTRDGIYINASNHNKLLNNKLHDLRYGIHYMYSYHNEVIDNHAKNVKAGYALMQSKFLTVKNNISIDTLDYGILLNFITNSTLSNNRVYQARQPLEDRIDGADGKALFVYNSLKNKITNNQFEKSDIGIHLTAGSEDNMIINNSFIDNTVQVKYVSNRKQEWSLNNRGNYWSNYLGWDLDSDGIGDTSFEPNDGVDRILWKFPQARLLMHSPGVLSLRWVQKQFPVLKSPGVKDSFPLMTSPIDGLSKYGANQVHRSLVLTGVK
jgi:nitrous oxidase accessory protein